MQKSWLLVSMLYLALVASFATPVLGAGKSVEVKYQFAGMIYDERNNMTGAFALTFSGRFQETAPDMETEVPGIYTYGPFEYNYSWTEYWGDNKTQYKAEVYGHHYEYGWESYHQYIAKWYSARASYNGRLFIIWADGSTSTFSVNLNPIEIDKFAYNSSVYQESRNEEVRTVYQWNPEQENWTFIRENSTRFGFLESGTISQEGLGMIFTGEIKGKNGRYNGLLIVADTEATESVHGTRYWDDYSEEYGYSSTYHEFMAMGKFGPYLVTAQRID